jgi:putative two-component system response regulator
MRSYTRALAEALSSRPSFRDEIDSKFIHMLYLTCPLHDIGKVGIPDSVLLCPGRLSEEQYEIMKAHTTIGAETLEAAMQQYGGVPFLQMARDVALTHHERWDGKGYPHGLAGEEIPLCGRIVAVADVYDALRSRRVYKDAFSHPIARGIIVDGRGTQFDPRIVDAFLDCEGRFAELHDEFTEQLLYA